MTWERFDHPCGEDQGAQWTMLAFEDGRNIGGYVGPSSWSDGKMRAYRGSLRAGTLQSQDFDDEAAARAFVEGTGT